MAERLFITPRRLGSAASGPRKGWAVMTLLVVVSTSFRDSSIRPFWAKNGPPSGRRTVLATSLRWASRSAMPAAACSASSGVRPSITTTIWSVFWGKAASTAASFWRQAVLGEISCAVSVVMAKWPAA